MKWQQAAYGVGLATAWWLEARRARTRGWTNTESAMRARGRDDTFTGPTAPAVGAGVVRPGGVEGAVPGLPGAVAAVYAGRAAALEVTGDMLAGLGSRLIDDGDEEAGLAALEAAGYCYDAAASLEGSDDG